MTRTLPDDVWACIVEAKKTMEVSTVDDADPSDYDRGRLVQNARLSRRPAIIAKCENAQHIKYWFDCAQEYRGFDGLCFVVRSGGHQHEARSTDDNALVLDLSKIHGIDFEREPGRVWIGTGTPLAEVVAALCRHEHGGQKGFQLPVGLCANVNAGGLTHGGGWGLSWRTHGMTIDQLCNVEIVTGAGVHIASAAATDERLLWALRGGGGGNFGVVTHLCFELTPLHDQNTPFSYGWDLDARPDVTRWWVDLMATADRRLNSFCRFSVPGERDALTMAGIFFGPSDDLDEILRPLFDMYPPTRITLVKPETCEDLYALFSGQERGRQLLAEIDESLPLELFALQTGPPGEGGPSSTCTGRHRHKVTSSFPYEDAVGEMIDAIDDYIQGCNDVDGASLYVSLHGMGGRGGDHDDNTSYPWRDEPFLIQGQAWWNESAADEECMAFIAGVREAMEKMTKGAFISFPDEKQDKQLYYGENYGKLRELKEHDYDPDDRLRYPLGLTWDEPIPEPTA